MCGRYNLRTPTKDLIEVFDLVEAVEVGPRFNIAPTQEVPAIRADEKKQRRMELLKWGLVPSWADDPAIGNRMINARSESAATKPSFRSAFKRRRCLIPADGFYEWKKAGRRKQPYCVARKDGRPFAMAGLWERWPKADPPLETFTILTTDANELLDELHDRMPVIVDPADYSLWLDPEMSDAERLEEVLRPYDAGVLTFYAVDPLVNNVRNDDLRCVEPVEEQGELF